MDPPDAEEPVMRNGRLLLALFLALLAGGSARAGGHFSVGVRLNFPFCGPCYGPPAYYYRPVYVAPAPITVQPAPVTSVAVPPPPVAVAVAAPSAAPASPVVARSSRPEETAGLASPDEAVRARAAVDAGRRKDRRAVGQLLQL